MIKLGINNNKLVKIETKVKFFCPCLWRNSSILPIIPKFKNTNEALIFGQANKGNQVIIKALRFSRRVCLIAVRLLNLMGKEDEAFYLASGQSQLVREALEEATK